jgi:acyl-CoA dehydrogenase
MLARWLCARCVLEVPPGPLTIGPVEPADRLDIAEATVSGDADYIPWGRAAAAVALIAGNTLLLVEQPALSFTVGKNLAGEPRDHLDGVELGGRLAPLPGAIDTRVVRQIGALFRAAQMAGAMEAALTLSTRYANDRIQFGRAIAKFQAIQQQLALLAENAAAASVAVASAAVAVAGSMPSAALAVTAAEIRAGEAAGKVAEIGHHVHGAIGFTHEHSLQRLTRRLWSWRDEFGNESHWSRELGKTVWAAGAEAQWPAITAE